MPPLQNANAEFRQMMNRVRAQAQAQVQRHGPTNVSRLDPGILAFIARARAGMHNNTGLHSLFINTKLVKLPTNKPIDPISHHTFKKGDVATRIRQNGKNTYFRTGSFNSWFGHNWKHMNANSNAKISDKKHPLTRANVTRKNVSRVKFV